MNEGVETKPGLVSQHKRPKGRFLYISIGLAMMVAIVVIAGSWLHWYHSIKPIPKNIRHSVGFALYYPSLLPASYSFAKNSLKVDSNIVFYSLTSTSQLITITEQAAPTYPPNLQNLQTINTSFKNVSTTAGQAILGVDPTSKAPVGILLTNTTLVNISGTKTVPTDVMTKVIQNMNSLPQ